MKSIVLVIPYFGKFPQLLGTWMTSVKYNDTVDFCIISDQTWTGELPDNVKIHYVQWEDVVRQVKRTCGEDIVLHQPYKLCDYRAAYGEIFENYICGYDFWGHCDFDIIFGNIRKFITEDILEENDRILTRGHFCLYRNTKEINALYKKTINGQDINYMDAFHTKYSCHFDEGYAIKKVFLSYGKGTYDNICFADIAYSNYRFCLAQNIKTQNAEQIYKWKKGVLTQFYLCEDRIVTCEYMYIHLQKRKMQIGILQDPECFMIIPNEICEETEVTAQYIKDHSQESAKYSLQYKKMRMRSIIKNIRNGALIFRLKGKLHG